LASPILAAILLTVPSYNNLFIGTALGFIRWGTTGQDHYGWAR